MTWENGNLTGVACDEIEFAGWKKETKKEIVDYAARTLIAMESMSPIAKLFGLKPVSQTIIEDATLGKQFPGLPI